MRGSIIIHLFGFASSFQNQGGLFFHPTAFRIRNGLEAPHQFSSTCLFENIKIRPDFAAGWNAKYQELVEFYKEHGHIKVNPKENKSLYQWMTTQRLKRAGSHSYGPLTKEQIRLLDELNFDWEPMESLKAEWGKQWLNRYQELAEVYKKHGVLCVEYRSSLYRWMDVQRRRRKDEEGVQPLTDEQIQLLDDIEFPWDAKAHRFSESNMEWIRKYQELAEFYQEHGHLKVSYEKGSPTYHLYRWMRTQRSKRRGAEGFAGLTDEQIQLLDDIGFAWDARQDRSEELTKQWHANYQQLAKFYKKHGHLEVDKSSSLHAWKVTQRNKRKGLEGFTSLTDEQIQLLDEIDFEWDVVSVASRWDRQYHQLAEFYKEHGHCMVDSKHSLYRWANRQRKRREALTSEQIRLLDDIEFPWDAKQSRAQRWLIRYQELADFYKKHGHLMVENNRSLFQWMYRQRRRRKEAALTNEQIQLLDDIEFPWE